MISKLELYFTIEEKERVDYQWGSVLHGVLMEQLTPETAEKLHADEIKPFAQNLLRYEDKYVWTIATLNEEMFDQMIQVLMKKDTFYVRHKNIHLSILEKKVTTIGYEAFVKQYYAKEQPASTLKLTFETPTAFKRKGKQFFIPDLYLIFQSVVRKFDFFSEEYALLGEELLDSMMEAIEIMDYNVRTTRFFVDKGKVKSFVGTVVIGLRCNNTLKSLIHMILHYAEYSGVGVKSTLGMGKVKVSGEREEHLSFDFGRKK